MENQEEYVSNKIASYEEEHEPIETHYDQEDLNLLEQIQPFTVRDYMSYDKTRELLDNEWRNTFDTKLTPLIEQTFVECQERNRESTFLYKAQDPHLTDLIELIRFHTVREYDVDFFKKYPKYTRSFLEYLDKQIK